MLVLKHFVLSEGQVTYESPIITIGSILGPLQINAEVEYLVPQMRAKGMLNLSASGPRASGRSTSKKCRRVQRIP